MTLQEARTALNITEDFLPVSNSNRPGTALDLKAITIHNTDNDSQGADARAHAAYMKGPDARNRAVSWHFTVDDGAVFQSLPIREVGWHAVSGNATSIGIEICENQGIDQGAANDRAALLTAVLLKENGLSPDHVVQHHHWTGKDCPHLLRHPASRWDDFLGQVKEHFDSLAGGGGDECTLCLSNFAAAVPQAVMASAAAAVAVAVAPIFIENLKEAYFSEAAHAMRIRDVPFYKLGDRSGLFHRGSMAIDVDGSPRAYHPDNASPIRLDKIENADGEGSSTTYIQGEVRHGHLGLGPRPGFYVSGTSLRYNRAVMWDCGNFLDAEFIPFTVYPDGHRDVDLGDLCIVVDIRTMRWTPAIVGDTGAGLRVSECSLRVAVNLGKSTIDPHTLQVHGLNGGSGDDDRNYFYLYFPGSHLAPGATSPHWPEERIRQAAEPLFAAWGGIEMVKACLDQIR